MNLLIANVLSKEPKSNCCQYRYVYAKVVTRQLKAIDVFSVLNF